MSEPGGTVELSGKWLANLLKQVEDNDYCFVCDNHPSHGHDKACPLVNRSTDG